MRRASASREHRIDDHIIWRSSAWDRLQVAKPPFDLPALLAQPPEAFGEKVAVLAHLWTRHYPHRLPDLDHPLRDRPSPTGRRQK